MTEQLPISIHVCEDLQQQFTKICSACNKLEAQFNFQTMTENWYEDEENILFVQLHLTTPDMFLLQQKNQQSNKINIYSDDVFSFDENNEVARVFNCYVAITQTELALLTKQRKLLPGFLQVKLQKVLNLIANQMQLPAI